MCLVARSFSRSTRLMPRTLGGIRRGIRRSPPCRALARPALALLIAIAAVLTVPALAADPIGSKNFTAPHYVPNYFSNEAGSFNGGASARVAPGYPAPVYAAPAARSPNRAYAYRYYSSRPTVRSRYRSARWRWRGHPQVASRRGYVHSVHVRSAGHGRLAAPHGRVASAGGRRR